MGFLHRSELFRIGKRFLSSDVFSDVLSVAVDHAQSVRRSQMQADFRMNAAALGVRYFGPIVSFITLRKTLPVKINAPIWCHVCAKNSVGNREISAFSVLLLCDVEAGKSAREGRLDFPSQPAVC